MLKIALLAIALVAAGLSSGSMRSLPARAGSAGHLSDQGALAPQTPGMYVLRMFAFGPHLSADGRSVAFSGQGSNGAYLALVPVNGGGVRTPLIGDPAIMPGDFSPDGNWIAFSVISNWPDFCLGP